MDIHNNGMITTTGQGVGAITPHQVHAARSKLMAPVIDAVNELLTREFYDPTTQVVLRNSDVLDMLKAKGMEETTVFENHLLKSIASTFRASGWRVSYDVGKWTFEQAQSTSMPTYRTPQKGTDNEHAVKRDIPLVDSEPRLI